VRAFFGVSHGRVREKEGAQTTAGATRDIRCTCAAKAALACDELNVITNGVSRRSRPTWTDHCRTAAGYPHTLSAASVFPYIGPHQLFTQPQTTLASLRMERPYRSRNTGPVRALSSVHSLVPTAYNQAAY
jgi:hypothetical protein